MWHLFHEIYVANISTILIIMPILLLVWSVIGTAFYKYMRIICTIATILAAAAILYATVFSRSISDKGIDLIPFSSFDRAIIQPEMYRSMLMNVFFFMPLGLALPFVFGGRISKRVLLTILVGFLLSLTVEAIQYFASLGMAETDDVICNTLGTAIGCFAYLLSLLWRKLFKRSRKGNTLDE